MRRRARGRWCFHACAEASLRVLTYLSVGPMRTSRSEQNEQLPRPRLEETRRPSAREARGEENLPALRVPPRLYRTLGVLMYNIIVFLAGLLWVVMYIFVCFGL